jgi:limonene-1,2-epoxide hydrolase
MTNTQRIHEFIAAWERRDLEAILVAMSEDVLYENVGLSLSRGRDGVHPGHGPIHSRQPGPPH